MLLLRDDPACASGDCAGPDPAPTIDTRDVSAVDQWAQRLNVSRDELLAAVAKVGNSIAAVRRQLHSA
jgi:hypothetical protein